ncbi:MAG: YbhB/YbcL family Raf kinase inhibitor-like protein [Solirubrobacterales bacterium]
MALTIESESITHGQRVPDEHAFGVPDGSGKAAAEGGNRSPHLRWSGHPEGTQSFAIVCVDPDVPADFSDANQDDRTVAEDAPRRDFTHWLVVDIPPDVTEVPEGAGSDGIVAGGKPTGETSFGGITGANNYTESMGDGTYGNYDGPFPPWNDERMHDYHFRVYALDVPSLGLEGDFKLDDVMGAIEGHVLDQGEIVASYTLNADKL